jgi:CheY-like chemotaxis protein/HPt (histidine-containing phosphotransfer) domain-containing protein
MERLEAYRYENGGDLVTWLREQVNTMDFEEIIALRLPGDGDGPAGDSGVAGGDILVVEDNEINRRIAAEMLRPLGLNVELAENGKDALRMLRRKHYHLVVMDHMMPVMDGIEATERLRRAEDAYSRGVPVVGCTASDEPGARERFIQAGMNDVLTKPFGMNELHEVVRRWLPEGKRLVRAAAKLAATAELPELPGFDLREGLLRSGSEALLTRLLGDFYLLIDPKSERIERCLAEGRTRELTVEVHALKHNARMLGAAELAESFERLEQLGNDGDLAALTQEVPAVLGRFRDCKRVLEPFGNPLRKPKTAPAQGELIAVLRAMEAAIDRFDLDGADAALLRLEALTMPESVKTLMDRLRGSVADVAAESAAETAREIIRILETTSG